MTWRVDSGLLTLDNVEDVSFTVPRDVWHPDFESGAWFRYTDEFEDAKNLLIESCEFKIKSIQLVIDNVKLMTP